MLAAAPAQARVTLSDPGRTYVEARAAAIAGNHARSAELLASLAQGQPLQVDLANKALGESIGAGQMELALRLARSIPAAKLSTDARLLLAADEIRRRRAERAVTWLNVGADNGDLSFLMPLIGAWSAADRGDLTQALANLDQIPANSLLSNLRGEQRALILLKFRRAAEAEPLARAAIAQAGAREDRLRLAFADGFLAAGDRNRALSMLDGMAGGLVAARQRILAGRNSGQAIDNLVRAYSEALRTFAGELARVQRLAAPIGLAQVARFADPQNSGATALLAVLLSSQDRDEEALTLLNSVRPDDGLISSIRDVQVRLLTDEKRYAEALAIASTAAASPTADVADFSRLGDVYNAMKRRSEAANAYTRALAFAQAAKLPYETWTLQLLRAGALEEIGRWPEAKQALEQGLLVAPDQPLLLNFLGYAKLERGEDLDAAEAMIRKASELAPDDASIMDSLGWAQFKRGKHREAIATLQKAAEKDASQAEIQEHLGDVLYTSGDRLQARFAWSAALVTAEDDVAARVKTKLSSGLSQANAAP